MTPTRRLYRLLGFALLGVVVAPATAGAGVPADGYPRPQSATPIKASLVPAYQVCTAPGNRMHGPPLAEQSCAPPAPASAHLTLGTPDSNGLPVNASGIATYQVLAGAPGGPDDSDVNYLLSLTDVRTDGGTYADYTGELQATTLVRITDRHNGPGLDESATMIDFEFSVTVPCAATEGTENIGSTCAVATSFDAVIPGAIPETKRTVWEVGRVRVFDGGGDGDAETEADNTLFAIQGIFVP